MEKQALDVFFMGINFIFKGIVFVKKNIQNLHPLDIGSSLVDCRILPIAHLHCLHEALSEGGLREPRYPTRPEESSQDLTLQKTPLGRQRHLWA